MRSPGQSNGNGNDNGNNITTSIISSNRSSTRARRPTSKLLQFIFIMICFSVYLTIINHYNIIFIDIEHNNEQNDDLDEISFDTTSSDVSVSSSGNGIFFDLNLGTLVQSVLTNNDDKGDFDYDEYEDSEESNKDDGDDTDIDINVEQTKNDEQPLADVQEDIQKNNDDLFTTTTKAIEKRNERQRNNDDDVDDTKTEFKFNPNQNPLNILLFYPDDWRHDSIGSEKPYIFTPFLDSLAKEGIRFTQNAVTTSVCWMSRATLWMGQYSSRHKSYKLMCPRFSTPANWEHSWVKLLQRRGYFVAHIGKWQYITRDTKKYFDWSRLFEGHHWEKVFGNRVLHASDLAAEHAMQFFKDRPKDKPFSLSVAFYPPKAVGNGRAPGHQFSPTNETRRMYENITIPMPETKKSFQLLPEFLHKGPAVGRFGQRYGSPEHFQASMKNYYALISGVDKACKEIVDKLKEEGLYNNTMIIFTTDNGMFHGSHGLAGKWYPYQESIRVPLIIYDPRMPKERKGTLDDSFTLNVDLAETILGAAGVKPSVMMQGRDISDLYLQSNEKNDYHDTASVEKEPWREEFFYEFPSPEEVFIPSSTALVRKNWKYIHWIAADREQLFNLKSDPLEHNDLYNSTDVAPVLEKLRGRHREMKEALFDPSYANDTKACKQFQIDLFPPDNKK